MNAIAQGWAQLRTTGQHVLEGVASFHERLDDRLQLGIVSRLVVAFVGIAALVGVTHVVVEKGVLVERTTQITRTIAPTRPPVRAVATLAATPPLTPPPEGRVVTSDALVRALEHYQAAVHGRASVDSEQNDATYQQAAHEVERAGAAFLTDAASISGKSLGRLSAALKAHQRLGEALVHESDERRGLEFKYSVLLDGLKTREKASLDKAWKIFGRVVTRQSLLQLSADLDALLRHSVAIESADSRQPAEMAALVKAELATQKDFDDNQAALTRSEGANWFATMRGDFTALVALRGSITDATDQANARGREFAQQSVDIDRILPSKVEGLLGATPIVVAEVGPAPSRKATDRSPEDVVAPAAVIETHSVTTSDASDRAKQLTVAWISAVVWLLLAMFALGTALSIIRPVRRLLKATERLADGDTTVRMPRGGLKELDTVAVAFNHMAEELSATRGAASAYRESLERRVTERTQQLQILAERDPLTGLPNRRELFVLLNAALKRAQMAGNRLAVFFLDVDNFKYINDSMGHAFGDRVLVSLARRLEDTVRDFGYGARLGGDEFTVVFEHAPSSEAIRAAGLRIVQAFQSPLTVDDRDLIVSVSVGASIYPEHESDAAALLQAADAALFRAKAMGRSQLSVFTPELLESAAAKFTTEQGLRRAIERGEFELVFQPEISVETLEPVLVEALIRWRMPDGRVILPSEFLAVAEESGLISEISDWVLNSAIETAAYWHHGQWPGARVAINVSSRQLIDAGFVERLRSLLLAHRLPTRCIEIELTESVLQTGPATIEVLKSLRAIGVAIALDDFGTGYSSLASLERLPLTRIKLDRSLIAEIDVSPRAAAIASAIISLCQGLGLQITAEGVERQTQFAMLIRHPEIFLQGFLLARPASRENLISLLAEVAQKSRELVIETSPRDSRDDEPSLPGMLQAAARD